MGGFFQAWTSVAAIVAAAQIGIGGPPLAQRSTANERVSPAAPPAAPPAADETVSSEYPSSGVPSAAKGGPVRGPIRYLNFRMVAYGHGAVEEPINIQAKEFKFAELRCWSTSKSTNPSESLEYTAEVQRLEYREQYHYYDVFPLSSASWSMIARIKAKTDGVKTVGDKVPVRTVSTTDIRAGGCNEGILKSCTNEDAGYRLRMSWELLGGGIVDKRIFLGCRVGYVVDEL